MNTENSIQPLTDALEVLSDAYSPLTPPSSVGIHSLESAKTLAELISQIPAEYHLPLRYHQARLLAMADNVEEAIIILSELLESRPSLPEAIWLNIQLAASDINEESNRLRWASEDRLGEMLPISGWGTLRDARFEEREAERTGYPIYDSPGPIIPLLEREKLLHIASLFGEMEMNAEASNAYREALYSAFSPPDFPEFGDESWVSSKSADAWLATTHIEAMLGRRMWSIHGLLMAVASSRSQLLPAKQLLEETLNDQNVIPEPAPDVSRLTQIAMLYRDCNLHPRAISALDEAAKIPGADVSELRADIENAWEELVASYARGKEPISFLFGNKVSEQAAKLELSPSSFPYGDER